MEISPEKSSSNESNPDRFEAHPSSSVPLNFVSTIPPKALTLLGLSLSDTSSTDKSSENTNSDQDNPDEEFDFGGMGELDLEEMLQKSQSQLMSKAKRDYFSDMNRYELLKVLDPGSQSDVFLVMDTTKNTKLVLKKVNLDDGIGTIQECP